MKKFGVYALLCVLGLWVSPGIMAASCVELAALLDDAVHEHSHAHTADAAGDAGHHDAASAGTETCCLQVFVGGSDEVTLTRPSLPDKPALSGKTAIFSSLASPLLPGLPHKSQSILAYLSTPSEGLQRPLYALFSTYLI